MPPKKRPVEDDTPAAGKRATKARRTGKKQTKKARPAMTLGPGERYSDFESDSEEDVPAETTGKRTAKAPAAAKKQTKKPTKKSQKSRPAMTLGPGERYSDFESDEESAHSETVEKPAAKKSQAATKQPKKPTKKPAKKPTKKGQKSRPAMTLGPGERYSDFESDSEESVHSESAGPAEPVEEDASESNSNSQEDADKDKVPMDEKDPYEYILMRRSPDDFEEENNAKPTNEQLDEEQIRAEFEKQGKEIPHDTAASTKPDHKWILMRGAWISFADAVRQRGYRSPDAFDMYIYNDFEGYGICEMVDNYIGAFGIEYAKKNPNLKDMWVTLTGFVHFLLMGDTSPMIMVDDGERVTQMATIIGRAYLSMLNLLDRAGQLGPDSEFKDLALVTALFLKVPSHFVDAYDEKEMDWKTYVQDYAECHKIDISFVFGSPEITFVDENVETLDDREGIPKAGVDRWGFKKAFNAYKKRHSIGGRLGGNQFDITKMSRSQRANYAFDKVDPLKDVPKKDLDAGNLVVQ